MLFLDKLAWLLMNLKKLLPVFQRFYITNLKKLFFIYLFHYVRKKPNKNQPSKKVVKQLRTLALNKVLWHHGQ